MKKAWLALCLLVLAPVTSFSQTPSAPPIDIAAILGGSPVTGSCAVRESEGFPGPSGRVQLRRRVSVP